MDSTSSMPLESPREKQVVERASPSTDRSDRIVTEIRAVVIGIAGGGIQDMVVIFSVLHEMAFVNAGGHYGRSETSTWAKVSFRSAKGFWSPTVNGVPSGRLPTQRTFPSQVDHGAFHGGVQEIRFQLIGNVALGDGAQIDGGAGIQEGRGARVPSSRSFL